MSEKDPIQEQTDQILEESKELLDQAEKVLKRDEELFASLGITAEQAENIIDWDKVPPEQKEQVQKELEEFNNELEQLKRDAVERHEQQTQRKKPRPGMRTGKIRI